MGLNMSSRNKYPKMETRRRFADEYVNALPNKYAWIDDEHIQRINDTLTLSNNKVVPCWNPPKHYSDFVKLMVDIKYIVRNAIGVKGSPWKWACEYQVMMDIREFPYELDNKIRDAVRNSSRVARRRKAG